ncbi:CRISPR-associated protein Csx16 [Sphaerotilus sp.]|uniref:CRISPR-associated protein Csx16 n=1 Tax=Sphaerotilus sp. TaxID=2093942 RepID=UPI00286DD349|nr:CRISPR-associated protein Csx16 [Sphaerotilus sp.]
MSALFFISRHPGAVEWARRQGLAVDHWLTHLDPAAVRPGDTVAGTLPIHLAAQVCARGGRYLHLSLDLSAHLRGRELSAEELVQAGARLEPYTVAHLDHRHSVI